MMIMALSSGIVATAANVRIVMCDVMLRFNDINKIIVRQQLRTEYRTSPDDGLQKLLLVMMLEFQGKSVTYKSCRAVAWGHESWQANQTFNVTVWRLSWAGMPTSKAGDTSLNPK